MRKELRSLLKPLIAGIVLLLGLGVRANAARSGFDFVQLSDIYWGLKGPTVNTNPESALTRAIAQINRLDVQPDFIVCTGDLTQTTDDPVERRRRMTELKQVLDGLKVKDIKFLPGDQDAALDSGTAYHEIFGPSYYSFDHKGVHFIALDNVSDTSGSIGATQLRWLSADLKQLDLSSGADPRVVVFTHRPLFGLYADPDWHTPDGDKVIAALSSYKSVPVFYGHIHEENHFRMGEIYHHAARGLLNPLPAPGSAPKRAPLFWDEHIPFREFSFRRVHVMPTAPYYQLYDYAVEPPVHVISVTARKFAYSPREITLAVHEPVVLELTSRYRLQGFSCPGLNIRADVEPGQTSRISFTPQTTGTFEFHCDSFYGEAHREMTGEIIVQ